MNDTMRTTMLSLGARRFGHCYEALENERCRGRGLGGRQCGKESCVD